MKVQITKRKIVRVDEEVVEIDIPEGEIYFFEFGYRRTWAIIPVWTTWNKELNDREEEVYEYNVVSLDGNWASNNDIKFFSIQVSSLGDLLSPPHKDGLRQRAARYITEGVEDRSVRTKAQFLAELNGLTTKIKETVEGVDETHYSQPSEDTGDL